MNLPIAWVLRDCSNGGTDILQARGARFSLRGLVLARTKPRKLKHAPPVRGSRAGRVSLRSGDAGNACAGCAPAALQLGENAHHAVLAVVIGLALLASNGGCVR